MQLFMIGFCVLYPKIFISNVFIKSKLPGIQDEHSISRFKTQRRSFIRERTIETRIWQRIDYCVITKENKIKRFVNCKHHNNCTRIN